MAPAVPSAGLSMGRHMSAQHRHDWRFDGDDPYVICACGERRDALTGKPILPARDAKKVRFVDWFRETVDELVAAHGDEDVGRIADAEMALYNGLAGGEARELRDLAKRARTVAASPDYDEEAIAAALWAVVEAAERAST